MVEIEEVAQNEDESQSDSPPATAKDADGWEKLMGDDLVMKVSEPCTVSIGAVIHILVHCCLSRCFSDY